MSSANEERRNNNRVRYGAHLKRLREEAKLTQAELGHELAMSASMVAHMEAGRRLPQLKDAKRMDEVLNAAGFFTQFLPTLSLIPVADHFAEALDWEQQAIAISEYAVSLVPGLLQTKEYARAVYYAQRPNFVPAEVDEQVVNRLKRAEIMHDSQSPTLWFILNENVIRAQVGSPETMAEQLLHIAVLGRSGRIRVQVVPHSSGAHATMGSMLSLMRFAGAPELAYVEALFTGNLIDDPAMVQRCKDSYDLARAAAMPPDASLDLLEEVAEEYKMTPKIPDASALTGWRKSSHSGGDNGSCIEVVDAFVSGVPVRDSKKPHGPAFVVSPSAWKAFVGLAKRAQV